jgi:hypothetical protein
MQHHTNEQSPEHRLRQMLPNLWLIQMIYVAAKLGIADLLCDGPLSVEVLATTTDVHAPSLYRVLRALASQGIFAEVESRRFELTPMAQLLRSDVPGSMRNVALWRGEPWRWHPISELMHSVKTGETAFNHVMGVGLFDYLGQNAEAYTVFNQEMTTMTIEQGIAVTDSYDFSQSGLIVDIGGGHGSLMEAILTTYPSTQGLIFDLPEVVEEARARLVAAGVMERCELVAGSFFESLPEGGDIYILKDIVHDWDDEHVSLILHNCHQVITNNSKLLIIERVIPPGNEAHFGKMVDIEMLTLTGGRERTEDEYQTLLRSFGFELKFIRPTSTAHDIMEAIPV